jgi:hypothetical protein
VRHVIGTSKVKSRGVPARTAVTAIVQVPGEGSDAPATVTWSAVTGVTGNLRAGTAVVAETCAASTARGLPPLSRKQGWMSLLPASAESTAHAARAQAL